MDFQTDVVIVGAGATGGAIARELSKYDVDVVLIDKNVDIGGYASRGNSATLICGVGQTVGSLAAKLQNASNRMYDQIAKDLDVEMKRIGSICVAADESELPGLNQTRKEGMINNVYNTVPLSPSKVKEMLPMITDKVAGGLFLPDDAIIDLFQLLYANVENAIDNGVRVMMSTKALRIEMDERNHSVVSVVTTKGTIRTKYVVNAAGIHADELARTTGICDYYNYPRAGQVYILDKNVPYMPKHIITPIKNELSRGILLTPTVHGNLMLGPSAENGWDPEDNKTTAEVLDKVLAGAQKLVPAASARDSITQFTGVRPYKTPNFWTLRATPALKGYIEAIGISGAVGAGPALAVYIAEMLQDEGLKMKRKDDYNPIRVGIRRFNEMSEKERNEHIKRNPGYGHIICRCETVTEAEIVEAIHRTPGARSVDGIKRRLRAGMGRCQGGFCSPRVVEILARELNVPAETICKNEPGSELLVGVNRK